MQNYKFVLPMHYTSSELLSAVSVCKVTAVLLTGVEAAVGRVTL